MNQPKTDVELAMVRKGSVWGSPVGDEKWSLNAAVRLSLEDITSPVVVPRWRKRPATFDLLRNQCPVPLPDFHLRG
ncbi:hypothetical protein [Gimesia panareensis]|uniref:hypothetical protein n=1 Tax=Gimesia panareensis TaxID=2527978 RepID=UPI0011A87190|nr:hypothetical protein [Gimesia panareensis]